MSHSSAEEELIATEKWRTECLAVLCETANEGERKRREREGEERERERERERMKRRN